jgi:ornithine decarboxylase
MDHFTSAHDAVVHLRPDVPLAVNRPHRVRAAARWFLDAFEGDILYAVKANPSPWVLEALWREGVRHFDVASVNECKLVRDMFPTATLAFMHPVKNRNAIARAYHEFGCRIFALDTLEELRKIQEETGGATDLTLMVRLGVSNADASLKLDSKFGTAGEEAVALLRQARAATEEDLGVCFHVGSQCMSPNAWRGALRETSTLIIQAGVTVDVVDVGGGFPAVYPNMAPPPMQSYVDEIHRLFDAMPVTMNCKLWAEPGRALVAEATSIVVKVDLRKGNTLYINDGSYGTLFDATHVKWQFPVRLIRGNALDQGSQRASEFNSTKLADFSFYGPTCDSMDSAEGPFRLPDDVAEGDWIEIGMLGAYGVAMATRFNGYGDVIEVQSDDAPYASMYPSDQPASQVVPLYAKR